MPPQKPSVFNMTHYIRAARHIKNNPSVVERLITHNFCLQMFAEDDPKFNKAWFDDLSGVWIAHEEEQ